MHRYVPVQGWRILPFLSSCTICKSGQVIIWWSCAAPHCAVKVYQKICFKSHAMLSAQADGQGCLKAGSRIFVLILKAFDNFFAVILHHKEQAKYRYKYSIFTWPASLHPGCSNPRLRHPAACLVISSEGPGRLRFWPYSLHHLLHTHLKRPT